MKIFRLFKDKWFYISLIIMILVVVAVFEFMFAKLDKFTRHGTEFQVPDLVGMKYEEATELYSDEFTFILLDSVYVKDFPEGAVYQQNPSPGSNVKKGRNIYIIRTSIAPEIVTMPNLRNLSLRQAMVSLNSVGLKVDKLEFVDYFARNAVIDQKIKDEVIEPKSDVVKGSAITLVVGLGKGNTNTILPDLIGVNVSEAKNLINYASLNIGTEIFIDSDDVEHLFVSRTDPEYSPDARVSLGSSVSVWYKSDKNFDFAWYNHEKYRRDSIVEAWRLRKYSSDTIQYVVDSFNFILKNRKFSYDSLERIYDKQLIFRPVDTTSVTIDFDFSDSDNTDYEIDTTFFYDE